jgi:phosphatidylinositol glycan class M
MNARALIVLAAKVRVALLVWGIAQDSFFEVPYTDVDYHVFTDAARFITTGHSPYERDTYRYSPLIAGALIPNVLVHPLWGKFLFAGGDLLAGWLIQEILKRRGCEDRVVGLAMRIWLFNPFTITVSTRGSCESLVSILMLTVLHAIMRGRIAFAAVVYGVATHLRIYPVIYALPMMAFLGGDEKRRKRFRHGFAVSRDQTVFATVSAVVFFAIGGACYFAYGHDFLHEAFLYHLGRSDMRHNFSPSFYGTYLRAREDASAKEFKKCIEKLSEKLVSVAPQLFVVFGIGAKYASDLPLCLFLQTLGFVAFNTVSTAQYFVWYFCLTPLAFPEWLNFAEREDEKPKKWGWFPHLRALASWQVAQVSWLAIAYLLEFCGLAVFFELWVASVAFLGANAWFLVDVVQRRRA